MDRIGKRGGENKETILCKFRVRKYMCMPLPHHQNI